MFLAYEFIIVVFYVNWSELNQLIIIMSYFPLDPPYSKGVLEYSDYYTKTTPKNQVRVI